MTASAGTTTLTVSYATRDVFRCITDRHNVALSSLLAYLASELASGRLALDYSQIPKRKQPGSDPEKNPIRQNMRAAWDLVEHTLRRNLLAVLNGHMRGQCRVGQLIRESERDRITANQVRKVVEDWTRRGVVEYLKNSDSIRIVERP